MLNNFIVFHKLPQNDATCSKTRVEINVITQEFNSREDKMFISIDKKEKK